jgi:hypothetical protein
MLWPEFNMIRPKKQSVCKAHYRTMTSQFQEELSISGERCYVIKVDQLCKVCGGSS